MKVYEINQQPGSTAYVNQTNPSDQPDKSQRPEAEKKEPSSSDKVELSAESKEMQKIYDTLQTTPDVREERVSELKKAIEEDRYKVDSEILADRMIKESILDLIK